MSLIPQNGEENGKLIRNPYLAPEVRTLEPHQKLITSSDW